MAETMGSQVDIDVALSMESFFPSKLVECSFIVKVLGFELEIQECV